MTNCDFLNIGFIGFGLIGGSIAKAIKAAHPEYHIIVESLKLSWLYRSMSEEKIEEHYREKAYKGFEEALQKEYPPICGMDENTISYLMSVLAYKSGDNDKAMQYGYSVISSRGASTKLKDKEREIIDILKAEK